MKYDDAEYYFLNFETDLPNEAGGRHIGLFLEWAILRGLANDELMARAADLHSGATNGTDLLFDHCDGKLTDEDLNEQGNAFATAVYEAHHVQDVFEAMNARDDEPDSMFSAELTPQRHQCVLWQLDRRYSDWLRQFGLPGKEALRDRVLAIVKPVFDAAGFTMNLEAGWGDVQTITRFDRVVPGGMQSVTICAVDFPQWFYGVRISPEIDFEVLWDRAYAERQHDFGITSSVGTCARIPFERFSEGYEGRLQTYNDPGFWILRDADIEPVAQWIAQRLRTWALPQLMRLDSVAALADVFATKPMSASVFFTGYDEYVPLLAAEMAGHSRLAEMLLEVQHRLLDKGPDRSRWEDGCLALVRRIRERAVSG